MISANSLIKYLKIIFFILFFHTGFSQCSFNVEILDCFQNNETNLFEYSLFKEDSLIGKYHQSKYFEKFPKGNYRIVFETLYSANITKHFTLNDKFPKTIKLCIDDIPKTISVKEKDYLISNIKNNEKVTLKFLFSGCFNEKEYILSFQKKKNDLFLIYNNKKRNITSKVGIIREFEKGLFSLKKTNIISTSNALYYIETKNSKFNYNDPGIWSGFNKMLIKLNIE
ncbi:hypothetical protein [Flavobacterium terrae]|uniref:Uncharacterized protein n=1 Tax=Flavobacterium terrae TaxID=415425 RepID=A0A1M6B4E3_9FLAO|nr:hypothetical protein [Flavobacterium terrae]SHI43566.1 hypothetical protein SAMN05444363_0551 [Flavobacterium terrae]